MTEGKVLEFRKKPQRESLLVIVCETESGSFIADIDDKFTIEAPTPMVLGQLLGQYLTHNWKPTR